MSGGMFSDFDTKDMEQSSDYLGGFAAVDSKIYKAKVKAFYGGKAASGAKFVSVVLDLGGGKEYKQTIYVSNKKGQNFYMTKDNKKAQLPGFITVNDIALIAAGKELKDLVEEEKVVKLWDKDLKKEVPTAVRMLTEVLGQEVAVGILKILENKSEKQGDEYVPTAETRETNEIDKVFHPELKLTVAEAREEKPAEFWDNWTKKNEGQLRDKRSIKDGSAPAGKGKAASGPPVAGGAGAAPKKTLFGK